MTVRNIYEWVNSNDVLARVMDSYEFICEALRDVVRDEMELMTTLTQPEREEYFRLKDKLVRLMEAAPMTEPFNETSLRIDCDNLDNYQAKVNEVLNGNT